MKSAPLLALLALLALPVLGCLLGCSGADNPDDQGDVTPTTSISSTAITLTPGEEKYLCWAQPASNGEALQVTGFDAHLPESGLHHYGLFTAPRLTPEQSASQPWECAAMGADWGLVTGGGVGTPGAQFPAGTAMNVDGGDQLILQLHLLNPSSSSLPVDPVTLDLDLAKAGESLQQVGLLVALTTDIDIPPHASDVTAGSTCDVPFAMDTIFDAFPHMHKLGTHISSEVAPAAGGSMQVLSDVTWDFATQGLYAVKGSAKAGDKLKLTCTYDNPSTDTVHFGLSTSDEMCVEVLYYYPATASSTYCQ